MGFKGMDFSNISMLDEIQQAVQANQSAMFASMRLESQVKEEQRQATIETAKNTSEMKEDLKTVIQTKMIILLC